MNLYQIDEQIELLLDDGIIDPETGEILNEQGYELLNKLELDRYNKIKNIALYIKNLESDSVALKNEEAKLAARRKTKENKAAWLKTYLSGYLVKEEIDKFDDAQVLIKFTKSSGVSILNEKIIPRLYKNYKQIITVDKNAIKAAIKKGYKVKGATIEERKNINIK